MVKIKGFRGWRPQPELASEIASQPYDVLNTAEARTAAAGNPYSFLHVVKSEIDLPQDIDPYDDRVYRKAADNLQKMRAKEWLIQDDQECLYIYRQIMGAHEQFGLVTVASVTDYFAQKIKIHELTREKKEKDRIRHVKTTNANTGPVFLTYKAHSDIDRFVTKMTQASPAYDFTAEDDIRHTFWVVSDPADIEKFKNHFAQIPHTYVADGHHRSKSAAMVGKIRKQENPHHTGQEEYNWFLAVLFPHNQLQILDYNRVVRDLHDLTPKEFIRKLQDKFALQTVAGRQKAKPLAYNHFGMYLSGQWYYLKAKPEIYDPQDPVESLDTSILHNHILHPLLAIGDPRKDERVDFVGGIRGLTELEKRVDTGDMAVAFALYPTSIEQLMNIADAGQLMPPKSTWFEPKLRSGLIIHDLE